MSGPRISPTRTRLTDLVSAVRSQAGISGKRGIARVSAFVDVSDPVHGPGDDGAVVELEGARAVVCGEAIAPGFVSRDPYGAGIAAVLANVNDVAAMGGVPRAIVNTVVGRDADLAEVLRGMRDAALMYDVPIVGGHLTTAPGDPSLSAFALGQVRSPLSLANVRPGQVVLLAACLEGTLRTDFPFFTTLAHQAATLARDVRLLARVADEGLAVAAKDVSMAGSLGSLAMLLEFNRFGATIDLDRLPAPAGVDPLSWLSAFPTYAFWLTTAPEHVASCTALFERHGLACAPVGTVTDTSVVTVTRDGESAPLMDLAADSVTGLWAAPSA